MTVTSVSAPKDKRYWTHLLCVHPAFLFNTPSKHTSNITCDRRLSPGLCANITFILEVRNTIHYPFLRFRCSISSMVQWFKSGGWSGGMESWQLFVKNFIKIHSKSVGHSNIWNYIWNDNHILKNVSTNSSYYNKNNFTVISISRFFRRYHQ